MTLYKALMRDNSKLIALGRAPSAMTKAQVQIYSSAGEGLLLFSVDARIYCFEVTTLTFLDLLVGSRQDCSIRVDIGREACDPERGRSVPNLRPTRRLSTTFFGK